MNLFCCHQRRRQKKDKSKTLRTGEKDSTKTDEQHTVKTDKTQRSNRKSKKAQSKEELTKKPNKYMRKNEAIKMLIECEERCDLIIDEARERYLHAIDRAEKTAEAETGQYRKAREKQLQAVTNEFDKEAFEVELQAKIKKEMAEDAKRVAKQRKEVVAMLIQTVVTIQPRMHRNQPDMRETRRRRRSRSKSRIEPRSHSKSRIESNRESLTEKCERL